MKHRHLVDEEYSLAAIDDIIDRGQWADWTALRRMALNNPFVMAKVEKIALAHAADPYAQRHTFWRRFTHQHGVSAGAGIPDPIIRRPTHMTGPLDGISTGIGEFTRAAPLGFGEPEMLRLTSIEILKSNTAQSYIDFATRSAQLGPAATAKALQWLDTLYPQSTGQSPLQQLVVQLAGPLPYDLDMGNPVAEWSEVKASCIAAAVTIFDQLNSIA